MTPCLQPLVQSSLLPLLDALVLGNYAAMRVAITDNGFTKILDLVTVKDED